MKRLQLLPVRIEYAYRDGQRPRSPPQEQGGNRMTMPS
jgi:hypothetical protein